MRLLLFDIDGTLVRCGRQVREVFAEALVEVFGTTGAIDEYDFGGKTDPRIVRDLMTGIVDLYRDLSGRVEKCKAQIIAAHDQRLQLESQIKQLCEGEEWALGLETEWQPDEES